jgi:hypothetical protein
MNSNNTTYRKPHPPMLINIPKTPINNNALRAQIFGPRTHQPTPASRIKPFRLRDKNNTVLLDPIGEVLRRFGSSGVVGVYQLHSVSRAEDLGLASFLFGREHLEAVEIAAVGDF